MIEIIYHKQVNCVTIKGHAGGAERGSNVPCGCASILAYTLAANVKHLHQIHAISRGEIRLEPGDTVISCIPTSHKGRYVRRAYENVCVGFELLAEVYPDEVSYEICED